MMRYWLIQTVALGLGCTIRKKRSIQRSGKTESVLITPSVFKAEVGEDLLMGDAPVVLSHSLAKPQYTQVEYV